MALRLEYFGIRGRGEVPRLILAATDIVYEDKRIQFQDWPAHKPTTPLGAMPVLVVDGKVKLSQAGVISRYLAVKTGLSGKNPTEFAVIDMIFESMQEVYWKLPLFGVDDEVEKEKKMKSVMEENIIPALKLFEKMAQNDHFLVGEKLSYADLALIELFHNLNGKPYFNPEDFPHLNSINKNVVSIPNIKKYLETRPKSDI